MKAEEYSEKAHETAVYPGFYSLDVDHIYSLNGVQAELSELLGKLIAGEQRKQVVMSELGDVCWYVQEACRAFHLDVAEVFEGRLTPFVDWPIEGRAPAELAAVVIDEARIASLIDKALRLDFGSFPEGNRIFLSNVERGLKMIVGLVRELARRGGSKLEDILEANIEKLKDRKERGKIRGIGDER